MVFLKNQIFFYALLALLAFLSCSKGKRVQEESSSQEVPFRYASLLKVEGDSIVKVVTIKNPWDTTRILHRYVLVSRERAIPSLLPEGTLLRVPLERVGLSSAVHCSLFRELGVERNVSGICDVDYVLSDYWKNAVRNDDVLNLGSSMNVDVEKVLSSKCEAVFLSPFNQGNYGAVSKSQIPIVECADYMETSPLGRAEWMRFYGMLMGAEAKADSLFLSVEEEYEHLSGQTKHVSFRPVVLMDVMQSGVWYQPSPKSTIGRLIADAGGRCAFGQFSQSGSVNLSFETVFHQAHDADVWLLRHSSPEGMNYASLAAMHDGYNQFAAWKQHKVWVCDPAKVPFFEETPFHPERLLKDFTSIFHPELKMERSQHYFTPLP